MVGAIAIRGERLVLARSRASGRDPEAIQNDALHVVEVDADDRIASVISYDLEDIDAGLAELDAQYLAGEAAPYAKTWSAVAGSYAALNKHELPLTTPDCVNVDHRRETAFGPGDVNAYIRVGWDSEQDINVYVEQVHRLWGTGAMVTYAAHETSHEGLRAEWRGIAVFTVDGDMINRTEVFDESGLDAAIAKFEQLTRPAPQLENSASRLYKRVQALVADRDWDAAADLFTEDYHHHDRRRVVNAGVRRGREAAIEDLRGATDVGLLTNITSTPVAIRGDRLILMHFHGAGGDHEAVQVDVLQVVEMDASEKIGAVVVFDIDDFDTAIAELDDRYLAGEASGYARAWSAIARSTSSLNRHEPLPTTHDWANIDHRRGISIAPGEMSEWLSAARNRPSNLTVFIESVHRLNDRGAVVTHMAHETSHDGSLAEWRVINVQTVIGDLIDRLEMFDESDLDTALTRFEQLTRPAPQLENSASLANKRFQEWFAARDWVALAQGLADDISHDDRRRVVGMGLRHGRDAMIAEARALVAIGVTNATSDVIAIRGQRLVFSRIRTSGRDQRPEGFHTDALDIVEVDAENRVVARVVFDTDDFDDAIAELEKRYIAGEAAAHAHTWSVITRAYAALNRREHPLTTADWSNVDHRRGISFAPGEGSALLANWDATPDFSNSVEAVHRLNDFGAVVTSVTHETSREGFHAEWRVVSLMTIEGDLIDRLEVFDESDLSAALARFEAIQAPARRQPENAASRLYERFKSSYAARDWPAITELMGDNVWTEDRRRVINSGFREGRTR